MMSSLYQKLLNSCSTNNYTAQCMPDHHSPLMSVKTTAIDSIRRRKQQKSVRFQPEVLMQQAITDGDQKDILQLISKYGSGVANAREPSGLSPAMRCVFESRMASLRILVQAGADLSHRDSENWTVLHVATSMDDVPAAKFILKRCKEDLTQLRSVDDQRPIDLAQSPEMVRLLQCAEFRRVGVIDRSTLERDRFYKASNGQRKRPYCISEYI